MTLIISAIALAICIGAVWHLRETVAMNRKTRAMLASADAKRAETDATLRRTNETLRATHIILAAKCRTPGQRAKAAEILADIERIEARLDGAESA